MSPPPLPPAAVALLACPVCGAPMAALPDASGLSCAAGHLFDRARQGHVTLLPPGHRPPSGDSAAMVADRAAFLAAGHFGAITAALVDALHPAPPASVLDLGGGTGQHLAGVLDQLPQSVGVVLDSSSYAARRGARAHPRAIAVVADTWARLPVGDDAVDAVLVVFAPRNGPEIARVLAPGGRLVVVTPAPDHLAEIADRLRLVRVDPDKAARLAGALEPYLERTTAGSYREVLALDRAAVTALVGMGPHARHLAPGELAGVVATLPERARVTVAVDVATYRRR